MSGEIWYYYNDLGSPDLSGLSDLWKSILLYGIRTATHFEAHFPDDDSDLAEGKEEFLRLPKISVKPWSGMKGAIAVHGEMTPEATALFMEAAEKENLWDYQLFRDGRELLSVSDNHDCLVAEHFLKEFLQKLFGRFEPFRQRETEPEKGSTDAFLKLFQEATKKALSDLGQDESAKEKP